MRSALRARELVQRILAYGRLDSASRRPTEVAPLLEEVCTLLRSAAPANVHIHCRNDAPEVRVLAASGELHQILMNLGTNAVLAMKDRGGDLAFTMQREGEGRLLLIVSDTGDGIPHEIRERIFDPYFSTREPGEGSGLGLAIVARLVADMGGTIRVDSEIPGGTRFFVSLPECARPVESGSETAVGDDHEAAPTQACTATRTVLVVDDEDMVRATTAMILTHSGYQVVEASSAELALQRLLGSSQAIDLLLTDQTMPGMTGTELIAAIRGQGLNLPVILCSGFLDSAQLERVAALGVRETLDKPFSRQDLLAAVSRQLRG